MTQHPAPWTSSGRAIVAADGTAVALVSPSNIHVPPGGVPGLFDEATLRLLCAAPLMKAALEEARGIVVAAVGLMCMLEHPLEHPAVKQIDAALAAARGE